ncbi:MAG TPA: VOC family protein, partial [Flavisolibacter sp.]|nr:VOC family protein [Flavisolibacter sp.]
MERLINGIQQVGIGVADAGLAFQWYKRHLGFDTVVFEDVAEATLMKRYTGGKVHQRYAALVMNMQGGGGLELWQYTNRTPAPPAQEVRVGDLGILAIKIRCKNARALHEIFSVESDVDVISDVCASPAGTHHFFVRDPFGNLLQLVEDSYWFQKRGAPTGGVCGAILGVSSIEKALGFYKQLDYQQIGFEDSAHHQDLSALPGGGSTCRRALIQHCPSYQGAFSPLLGPSSIELLECEETRRHVFRNRWWGDLGFIHLCYDLSHLEAHESLCSHSGCPLTINSQDSFDMGAAAGHFAYNEDPDGTLIEYVETHKVPIIKKLGWYLDLKKR